jgi:hypothetical protein
MMIPDLTTVVIVLKTLMLVLGGLITFYGYKAYRRTGSPSLRILFIGFGIVTFGALLAGIVDQLLGVNPDVALVVESLFTVIGFGAILLSLYSND